MYTVFIPQNIHEGQNKMSDPVNSEEEIRQHEIACLETLRALDLTTFLSFYHEDVYGWPGDQTGPVGKAAIGLAEAAEMEAIQPGTVTIELKTSQVRTFGEVGVIYCEMHFGAIMKDGAPLSTDLRWTHTWLRTQGGWKIIGGMSLPVSHPPLTNG